MPRRWAGLDGLGAGLQAHRQDHHVEQLFLGLAILGDVLDAQAVVVGRVHRVDPGAHETHPLLILGPVVVLLKVLAVGAHVHEEDGGVQFLGGVLLGDHRLLYGVHATHRRTIAVVAVVDVPAAHALEPSDLLGLGPVAGALEVALVGARSAEHPLKLHGRKHVGMLGVGVGVEDGRVKGLEARSQDHAAHVEGEFLWRLVMGRGVGLAGLHALEALAAHRAVEAALALLPALLGA